MGAEGLEPSRPFKVSGFSPSHSFRCCRSLTINSAVLRIGPRSEEHTSELQSLTNLVCRLLLEKKKKKKKTRGEQKTKQQDKRNVNDKQSRQ